MDLYCERIGSGLWAEPVNVLSNMAFFLATWAIWHLADRHNIPNREIKILISLTGAIAIGSTLFHLFATQWAYALDIIPIVLFQICYIWLYLRQIVKLTNAATACLVGVFLLVCLVSTQWQHLLNGSLVYAPAFLVLLALAVYHLQQQKNERLILLVSANLFLVSLIFRTIDEAICPHFSLGTHFLWHLLNGGLLYLSARGLILNWSFKFPKNQ